VVVIAEEEARTFAHANVGSEHILLGLLRERDGLAGQVHSDLGIDVETVCTQVAVMAPPATGDVPRAIPLAAGARRVLEHAVRQSLQLGHDFIGTEHLLLGLLSVTDAGGADILQRTGVSYETVRAEIAQRAPGASSTRSAGAGEVVRRPSTRIRRY
jgi:ATP-dependent Clp protease ATP-binding subunit ClpC